jgi:hypothetical protein
MKVLAIACLTTMALWAQRPGDGLPPRADAADYAARGEDKGVRIAAEIVGIDQVRNSFSTDLSNYIVVEVAVWPASKALDLSAIDFALKLDGSRAPIRPVSPRTIAGVLQRKGQSRRDDIVLFPSVGVTTGTWGTGTNVGVGVGMGGGGAPGPASTDQDRRTMQLELEEKELPDVVVQKPVAGYLYFPAGAKGKKLTTIELIYDSEAASVRLTLPADR